MNFLGASCKSQLNHFSSQGWGLLVGSLQGQNLLPMTMGRSLSPTAQSYSVPMATDKPMQLNQALFMLGGRSGYVLQPDIMRDETFDPFDKNSLKIVEPITVQLQASGRGQQVHPVVTIKMGFASSSILCQPGVVFICFSLIFTPQRSLPCDLLGLLVFLCLKYHFYQGRTPELHRVEPNLSKSKVEGKIDKTSPEIP